MNSIEFEFTIEAGPHRALCDWIDAFMLCKEAAIAKPSVHYRGAVVGRVVGAHLRNAQGMTLESVVVHCRLDRQLKDVVPRPKFQVVKIRGHPLFATFVSVVLVPDRARTLMLKKLRDRLCFSATT